MMDLESYVLPLFRRQGDERSFAGTAFCINGYLVTAAHVINTESTYYAMNRGYWIPLDFSRWLPQQPAEVDKRGFDAAFYPAPGLKSPLSLADDDASVNDELEVVCWQWRPEGLSQVVTQSLVLDEPDDHCYLRLSTVDKITHGSSGAPVIADGKVYGIIAMGRDFINTTGLHPLNQRLELNTCWAYKVSQMRQLLADSCH